VTSNRVVRHIDDLAPNLHSENIVIMDNLPAHKVDGLEQSIVETGAMTLCLPTYSPDFNPIEMLWAELKYFIRLLRSKSLELIKHL
jgi:transposase